MLGFSFVLACGANKLCILIQTSVFFVFLGSRDVENLIFRVKIIRFQICNVFNVKHMSFYIFVGAPTGPDPRRAPPGPRGGPRGTPSAQGRAHQSPGPDAVFQQ